MLYIGIDPGVSGGIAILLQGSTGVLSIQAAEKMPSTDRDLLDFLDLHVSIGARAVLERVASSPQMGVVSAFTFGTSYGAVRMALAAKRIPFEEVRPQKWQQALGCLSGGDKNVTKRRAQQLFPQLTITHAIADALLIADYCRRLSCSNLGPTKKRSA